jgi:hypothetical protein
VSTFGVPLAHFGVPLAQFGVPLGHFGVPLAHFGVPLGQFGVPVILILYRHAFQAKCLTFLRGTSTGNTIRWRHLASTNLMKNTDYLFSKTLTIKRETHTSSPLRTERLDMF